MNLTVYIEKPAVHFIGVYIGIFATENEIRRGYPSRELEETQKKAADKKLEQKRADAQELEAASYKMELKGKDLEDLTNQFTRQLSLQAGVTAFGGFDVKA